MATIVKLCQVMISIIVVQICQSVPVRDTHSRQRRFIATRRDGFCPSRLASSAFGVDCKHEALAEQCHFDSDCGGISKCCQHKDCIDVYICRLPLTAVDLGLPYFRPGRCYDVNELMKYLGGTCTEEASCKHDDDCSSPDKCCFVESKCGYTKQCYKSVPCCSVRGMTYGFGDLYYRDNGCLTCTCTAEGSGAIMECVEELPCIKGVPIVENYLELGLNNYNRISDQEGMVIQAGVASMNNVLQGNTG